MKITPNEITRQDFGKIMRGYDPDEVDAWLEQIARDLERTLAEKKELEARLESLDHELTGYRDMDRKIRDSLVSAQDSAGAIRENARKEAELLVREAHIQADEMMNEARGQLSGLRSDIEQLKTEKVAFISRFRRFVDSQLELLAIFGDEAQKDPADE